MAEVHSNFYFKHPNKDIHGKLVEMLGIFDLNSEYRINDMDDRSSRFIEIAKSINLDMGERLADEFLKLIGKEYRDEFGSESISEQSGYSVSHWVDGSVGYDIQVSLMYLFYKLSSDVHAQSWSCGDDDPFESWLKFENGKVIYASDEPYSTNDAYISGTVYRWWHSEMPNSIKEGFIYDEDYREICEENYDKVFLNEESEEVTDDEYKEWLDKPNNLTVTYDYKESIERSIEASRKSGSFPTKDEIFSYIAMQRRIDRNRLWMIWYLIKKLITGRAY